MLIFVQVKHKMHSSSPDFFSINNIWHLRTVQVENDGFWENHIHDSDNFYTQALTDILWRKCDFCKMMNHLSGIEVLVQKKNCNNLLQGIPYHAAKSWVACVSTWTVLTCPIMAILFMHLWVPTKLVLM